MFEANSSPVPTGSPHQGSVHVTGLATLTEGIPASVFLVQVWLALFSGLPGESREGWGGAGALETGFYLILILVWLPGFPRQASESKPTTRVECRGPRAMWGQAWGGLPMACQLGPGFQDTAAVRGVWCPRPTEAWLWRSLLVGFPTDNLIR